MKNYLAVMTILFALLAIDHLWRTLTEPMSRDPWIMVLGVVAACLSVWSGRLYLTTRSGSAKS